MGDNKQKGKYITFWGKGFLPRDRSGGEEVKAEGWRWSPEKKAMSRVACGPLTTETAEGTGSTS